MPVYTADTRILDHLTGEVIAQPGDHLDDEQLYRLEMMALTPTWVQAEIDAMEAKRMWGRGDLELWRVDAPYGNPSFVVYSPHGDEIFNDGQAAIQRIRELRAEYQI